MAQPRKHPRGGETRACPWTMKGSRVKPLLVPTGGPHVNDLSKSLVGNGKGRSFSLLLSLWEKHSQIHLGLLCQQGPTVPLLASGTTILLKFPPLQPFSPTSGCHGTPENLLGTKAERGRKGDERRESSERAEGGGGWGRRE